MINSCRQRWFNALCEHGKRAVTVIVTAAILVSSCSLDVYAQQPASHRNTEPQTEHPDKPTSTSNSPIAVPRRQSIATAPQTVKPVELADSLAATTGLQTSENDSIQANNTLDTRTAVTSASDSTMTALATAADSIATAKLEDEWVPLEVEFNPDPSKATWMSALFPGLGQVYNRRYWKLPIIVGGYLGLAYATSWNNSMLRDYTNAYADLLDKDPNTRSYMDMFAPNVKEENIDRAWLQNLLRSRKNFFRRNRDLCIIAMVGVYLLAMVDAYVDASLSHFDISPDLSMDVAPALMQDGRQRYPSVGMVWAINF